MYGVRIQVRPVQSRYKACLLGFSGIRNTPLLTAPALQCATPALADALDKRSFQSFDDALRQAKQEQRRVFLCFGRHGCPSCDRTNCESFSDERAIKRFNDHYMLAYHTRLFRTWGDANRALATERQLNEHNAPPKSTEAPLGLWAAG